jgi:hypothetical protein
MTAADHAVPPPENLTARVFRALYPEFDLHTLAGTYLAVPAGTPCFTAPALGEIARQISGCEHCAPDLPDALHGPCLPRRPEPRR